MQNFEYKKIEFFNRISGQWLSDHPEDSELGNCIFAIVEQLQPIFDVENKILQKKCRHIEIKCCEKDKNGFLIKDQKNNSFLFSEKGAIKCDELKENVQQEWDKKMYKKVFEIEPCIAENYPEDLTWFERKAFEGLVIPEGQTNKKIAKQVDELITQ